MSALLLAEQLQPLAAAAATVSIASFFYITFRVAPNLLHAILLVCLHVKGL